MEAFESLLLDDAGATRSTSVAWRCVACGDVLLSVVPVERPTECARCHSVDGATQRPSLPIASTQGRWR